MKILITGSKGFLGKNLIEALMDYPVDVVEFNSATKKDVLFETLKDCDFVFNFAAVHRPNNPDDFYKINVQLLRDIVECLEANNNMCPVLYTSSIQAVDNSDYGRSKLAGEAVLRNHARKMNTRGIIYRLTNIFGKSAKPNSHSVVATFCYNIQRGMPIIISNPNHLMHFYYIDEVVNDFVQRLFEESNPHDEEPYTLSDECIYSTTLSELADMLHYFKDCDIKQLLPVLSNKYMKYAYYTYCSYK